MEGSSGLDGVGITVGGFLMLLGAVISEDMITSLMEKDHDDDDDVSWGEVAVTR